MSTTIGKYCYLMCRYLPPFFPEKHRVVWSHIETVNSIQEILHPAVREGLRYLDFDDSVGLEIHHQGDLPARSGIGSSSSFSVGLINALMALKHESIGPHNLGLKAIDVEQNFLRESVGSQDQVAAAFGGFNVIRFSNDGTYTVDPLELSRARIHELESYLMLLYSGSSRLASQIASAVIANLRNRAPALERMHRMVDEAASILIGEERLETFGELLHEAWELKKSLVDGVSTAEINSGYKISRANGAIGGKLLGAGGTGFMLLVVPPEKQSSVRNALGSHVWVPFSFERTGSKIIYRDQDLYSVESPDLIATGGSNNPIRNTLNEG